MKNACGALALSLPRPLPIPRPTSSTLQIFFFLFLFCFCLFVFVFNPLVLSAQSISSERCAYNVLIEPFKAPFALLEPMCMGTRVSNGKNDPSKAITLAFGPLSQKLGLWKLKMTRGATTEKAITISTEFTNITQNLIQTTATLRFVEQSYQFYCALI